MKVLVTGATGFLGRAVAERLLARGETDVRCLVRPGADASALRAIASRHPAARVELFAGSLASSASASHFVEGVDVVYHLAASLSGAPADIFLNTVVASKNLLEAIVTTGRAIKIVLVSSFGVYGYAALPRGAVVDESTALEDHPERRDPYSHAKLRQEQLFRDYQARHGFTLTVLRPGVIHGPGGSEISPRVGLNVAGVFLHLGGNNLLPLTYVENCADALVLAGQSPSADGETYNVVDDGSITAAAFLSRYLREVRRMPVIRVPYPLLQLASRLIEAYSRSSRGQLPPIFTPYKTATTWKPTRFDNRKLKSLGWQPLVPTEEALQRTFDEHRTRHATDRAQP